MQWRRTERVQEVGAILLVGPDAASRLDAALSGKPAPLQAAEVVRGDDWAVVFAVHAPGPEADETLLPRLDGGAPLYQASPGWWLPVGTALDVPDHVREALRRAACERYGFEPPAVVVPRLEPGADRTHDADVYLIRHAAPYRPAEPA